MKNNNNKNKKIKFKKEKKNRSSIKENHFLRYLDLFLRSCLLISSSILLVVSIVAQC